MGNGGLYVAVLVQAGALIAVCCYSLVLFAKLRLELSLAVRRAHKAEVEVNVRGDRISHLHEELDRVRIERDSAQQELDVMRQTGCGISAIT